jgi:hypothetical protein
VKPPGYIQVNVFGESPPNNGVKLTDGDSHRYKGSSASSEGILDQKGDPGPSPSAAYTERSAEDETMREIELTPMLVAAVGLPLTAAICG